MGLMISCRDAAVFLVALMVAGIVLLQLALVPAISKPVEKVPTRPIGSPAPSLERQKTELSAPERRIEEGITSFSTGSSVSGVSGKILSTILRNGVVGAIVGLIGLVGVIIAQILAQRRHSEALEHTADLETRRAHEAALQKYFEQVGKLLIDQPLRRATPSDNLSTVVRAQTLTVLEELDPDRKRILLQFLNESALIRSDKPVVSLAAANLSSANLEGGTLTGAYLNGANLEKARLRGANLRGASLKGANLRKADLREGDLVRADLRETDLSNAKLREAKLNNAYLSKAQLMNADLTEANLDEVDLRKAILSSAWLMGIILIKADLTEADLSRADLSEAILGLAILKNANLSETTLREANLAEANLSGTDLSGADLRGACLIKADLNKATLSEATLDGADLSRSNVTVAQLAECQSLKGATVPDRSNKVDS